MYGSPRPSFSPTLTAGRDPRGCFGATGTLVISLEASGGDQDLRHACHGALVGHKMSAIIDCRVGTTGWNRAVQGNKHGNGRAGINDAGG
jgi:hypothetical protein